MFGSSSFSVLAPVATAAILAAAAVRLVREVLKGSPPRSRAEILRALAEVIRAVRGGEPPR